MFSKHDFGHCGVGHEITLKLTNSNENCTVKIKPELKQGDFLTWKNHDELDVCFYFNINDATKISIETTSETSFCPSMIKIQMADSKHTSYISEMSDRFYDNATNHIEHNLQKVWPTSTKCNIQPSK